MPKGMTHKAHRVFIWELMYKQASRDQAASLSGGGWSLAKLWAYVVRVQALWVAASAATFKG